jgi:hypothetical protein
MNRNAATKRDFNGEDFSNEWFNEVRQILKGTIRDPISLDSKLGCGIISLQVHLGPLGHKRVILDVGWTKTIWLFSPTCSDPCSEVFCLNFLFQSQAWHWVMCQQAFGWKRCQHCQAWSPIWWAAWFIFESLGRRDKTSHVQNNVHRLQWSTMIYYVFYQCLFRFQLKSTQVPYFH